MWTSTLPRKEVGQDINTQIHQLVQTERKGY